MRSMRTRWPKSRRCNTSMTLARLASFWSSATESSRSRQMASAALWAAFCIMSGRAPGTNNMLRVSRAIESVICPPGKQPNAGLLSMCRFQLRGMLFVMLAEDRQPRLEAAIGGQVFGLDGGNGLFQAAMHAAQFFDGLLIGEVLARRDGAGVKLVVVIGYVFGGASQEAPEALGGFVVPAGEVGYHIPRGPLAVDGALFM